MKTYKSHDEMKRSAKKMHGRGFRIEGQSGQFNTWWMFSGKHTVTVTWVREEAR